MGLVRPRGAAVCTLAGACACLGLPGLRAAAARPAPGPRSGVRVVRYHGVSVTVPRTWPVFDLRRHPAICVRFDRHAVYLGAPGGDERCPAHSVGRSEAILMAPLASRGGASAATAAGLGLEGNVTSFRVPKTALELTVSWGRSPGLVARALGRRSLPPGGGLVSPPGAARSTRPSRSRSAARAYGTVYRGLGFDACSAPSAEAMSAWSASPYRVVGVYIGGVNAACAQPNLTPRWVAREMAAGWRMIPVYVGREAPGACGCVPIGTRAASQGAAAARDAARRARALGMAPGSPIYYDLENYPESRGTKARVLAFLRSWTNQLHLAGYASGVYSNPGSGIGDLVHAYGTGFPEPDDIWIAAWNGRHSTVDRFVPRNQWSDHQRLHQYRGSHNVTYRHVTINIDSDAANGAVAYRPPTQGYLVLTSSGGVRPFGRIRWCGSDAGRLRPGVRAIALARDRASGGYWILKSNGGVDAFNAPAARSLEGRLDGLRPVALAAGPTGGYLILTSDGGMYPFGGAVSYGADAGRLPAGVSAVAMAVDSATGGYWILRSDGGVDAFHAPGYGSLVGKLGDSRPVGLQASPQAGYLILTDNGGVHPFGPASSYGSDAGRLRPGVSAIGLETAAAASGYRILRSDGGIDGFHAPWYGSLRGVLPRGQRPVAIAAVAR
jgi:hypothetical protein